MLSLRMLKSTLDIDVEIWLECLAGKNSPEKLIHHFQSSTGPNLFWAVSLVRPTLYHMISVSQISSLTLQKVIRIQVLT